MKAGVTVKALRHYERLGLLRPERAGPGAKYRVYGERDLAQVATIGALRQIGLSLKEIGAAMDRPEQLSDLLGRQRAALEAERRRIDRVIAAIRCAERSPNPLERMLEMMMVNEPDAEGALLRREIAGAVERGEDPAGDVAQALADRWLVWWIGTRGQGGRERDGMIAGFLRRTAENSRRRYFPSDEAWERFVKLRNEGAANVEAATAHWQASVDLFASAGQRPVEELRALWQAHLDRESAGDAEIRASLARMWAERSRWTATLRWRMEGQYGMVGERFDNVAAELTG